MGVGGVGKSLDLFSGLVFLFSLGFFWFKYVLSGWYFFIILLEILCDVFFFIVLLIVACVYFCVYMCFFGICFMGGFLEIFL